MTNKQDTYEINPMKLAWPTDRQGITQKLQREGCRAIGRMGADARNYQMVMEVLKVLAKHAKAKLEDQQAVKNDAVGRAVEARVKAEETNALSLVKQERQLTSQMASLGKRLAALKARAGNA